MAHAASPGDDADSDADGGADGGAEGEQGSAETADATTETGPGAGQAETETDPDSKHDAGSESAAEAEPKPNPELEVGDDAESGGEGGCRGRVVAENVGGIEYVEQRLAPGGTVLVGRNASGRSSLLRAVLVALGGTRVSVRAGAAEARAEVTLDGETFTRRVTRSHGELARGRRAETLTFDGDPCLGDARSVADAEAYAWLTRDNPIRRVICDADACAGCDADDAAARGASLRAVLMRAVDTDAIDQERAAIQAEISELEARRDELAATAAKAAELREERDALRARQDDLAARIEEVEAEIDALEAAHDSAQPGEDAVAAALADLHDAEDRLAATERERVRAQRRLDALRAEHADAVAARDALAMPDTDPAALQERRDELVGALTQLDEVCDRLDAVLAVHDSVTAPTAARDTPAVTAALHTAADSDSDAARPQNARGAVATIADGMVVDTAASTALGDDADAAETQTDEGEDKDDDEHEEEDEDAVVCWTCGQRASTARVSAVREGLREARDAYAEHQDVLEAALDRVEDRLTEWRTHRVEREERADRVAELEDAMCAAERDLDGIDERIEEIEAEIGAVQARLKALEVSECREKVIELHEELAATRQEHERVAEERAAVEDDLAAAVAAGEEQDTVESKLVAATVRRADLEDRVVQRERDLIAETNEQLDAVVDALAFDNLHRVWLARDADADCDTSTGDDAHPETAAAFRVRVERETDDGRVVADRVANLSASEREVVGIVLALAGYRVHDVHEDVPVVVLDGVEAIDADRLAALLEYIAEHAPYLIAAVLPADADAAALEERFPGAVTEVNPV